MSPEQVSAPSAQQVQTWSGSHSRRWCLGLRWAAVALAVLFGVGCSDYPEGGAATLAVELNDASFQSEVLESAQPVLVEFWAPWCRPCLEMQPAIEELAREFNGRVTVARINIDENTETAATFEVSSPPVFLLFDNGAIAKRRHGRQTLSSLKKLASHSAPTASGGSTQRQ